MAPDAVSMTTGLKRDVPDDLIPVHRDEGEYVGTLVPKRIDQIGLGGRGKSRFVYRVDRGDIFVFFRSD